MISYIWIIIASATALNVQIVPQKTSIELEVGAQLSLLCKVTEVEPSIKPGITWTRNEGISTRENVKVTRLDNVTLSLVIDRTIARDSGVYSCTASAEGQLESKTVDVHVFETNNGGNLFVDYGQLKTIKIPRPIEGKSLDLSCETINNGITYKTIWSRNHLFFDRLDSVPGQTNWVLIKGGSVLRIKNYNSKIDDGRYDCGVSPKDSGNPVIWRSFYLGQSPDEKTSFAVCRQVCQDSCNNVIYRLMDKNV